jgi:hypothetical protein
MSAELRMERLIGPHQFPPDLDCSQAVWGSQMYPHVVMVTACHQFAPGLDPFRVAWGLRMNNQVVAMTACINFPPDLDCPG